MELEQFVHDTLVGIAKGVTTARGSLQNMEATVNPVPQGQKDFVVDQAVDFDVAVTVGQSVDGQAKGGLEVMSIGLSGKVSGAKTNESVSRIKFSVRMSLPTTAVHGQVVPSERTGRK